jgi:large subunit ribosomal protein L21
MYAIVDIAGQQFKVEKDQKLFVHRLEAEEGSKVTFEKVYLIDNEKSVAVGDPLVKGATVSATIVNHLKGDKVLVFKKKRRKGYKKLNGHRQFLTQIQIEGISEKSAKPAAAQKAASTEKEAAPKATSAKPKATAAKPKTEEAKATAAKPKATAAKPKATAAKPKATAAKPKAPAKPKAAAAKKDDSKDKSAE